MKPSMAPAPVADDFYRKLLAKADLVDAKHRRLTPKSAALMDEARAVLPGGSTRDSLVRWPYPVFVERGEGAYLFDVDHRRITDFWFNATSLPLGYCHPKVMHAVSTQLARGTAFFAPGEQEVELAKELLQRLPAAEKVRFTNSGSEAVMLALRLARGATGRAVVAKFEGSYHGTYDDVSWSVGPPPSKFGVASHPNPVPESAGLPSGLGRVLVLPYNNLDSASALIEQHAREIAALIIEPIANRMGFVLPRREFLQGLRELCNTHGIVMIFDEVIAFRVGYHGAQGVLGIDPDLTTLGKVIGGGFPVGAVAGKSDILMYSDPSRPERVTHAGTFNGNPVTMVAGLETLHQLTPDVFERMNAQGQRIRDDLKQIIRGLPLQISGTGSLFKISATDREIVDYRGTVTANRRWEEVMSAALLNEGYFLTPRLQGCLSAVTTDDHIRSLLESVDRLVR